MPATRRAHVEECLAYFRRAIADPLSVPPWSEWWAANVGKAEAVFPLVDYVRLKHRKLLGAQQILQFAGELPANSSRRARGFLARAGSAANGRRIIPPRTAAATSRAPIVE